MFGRARALMTIAACAIATSVAAQAPAPTTAFDGKYAGVSKESSRFVSGGERAHCAEYPKGVPASLTIMNGVIRSAVGGWEGTVSPQGVVVMRLPNAVRFEPDRQPRRDKRADFRSRLLAQAIRISRPI
jgi:hypothetical protein